jgi:hypothetical protein
MGPTREQIEEFWRWFAGAREEIAKLLDARNARELADMIQARLSRLYPSLQWEVGPGLRKEFQFVISPGGRLELRPLIREIVGRAPELPDWEFHGSRQPAPGRLTVTLPESGVTISARGWTFSHSLNPLTARIDLILHDDRLCKLENVPRLRAALLILDGLLGEELVEDWLGDLAVTPSRRDARPIEDLARIYRSIVLHHPPRA